MTLDGRNETKQRRAHEARETVAAAKWRYSSRHGNSGGVLGE
jgi:hypothetical protein